MRFVPTYHITRIIVGRVQLAREIFNIICKLVSRYFVYHTHEQVVARWRERVVGYRRRGRGPLGPWILHARVGTTRSCFYKTIIWKSGSFKIDRITHDWTHRGVRVCAGRRVVHLRALTTAVDNTMSRADKLTLGTSYHTRHYNDILLTTVLRIITA